MEYRPFPHHCFWAFCRGGRDLFKTSRLFRLKRFTVAAFGGVLALLLLTLSCLAWLTPAVVLVAAASGITFALLLIEEFKR